MQAPKGRVGVLLEGVAGGPNLAWSLKAFLEEMCFRLQPGGCMEAIHCGAGRGGPRGSNVCDNPECKRKWKVLGTQQTA